MRQPSSLKLILTLAIGTMGVTALSGCAASSASSMRYGGAHCGPTGCAPQTGMTGRYNASGSTVCCYAPPPVMVVDRIQHVPVEKPVYVDREKIVEVEVEKPVYIEKEVFIEVPAKPVACCVYPDAGIAHAPKTRK